MNNFMSIFSIIFISYLVGSINLSYLMGLMRGYDIRENGSGNAGASNVVIMMGRRWGLFVALIDIFKAFFVVSLAARLFPDRDYAGALAGTSVILGHIFPFYMRFRGGKGLATLGGTVLALDPKMFVILLTVAVILAVAFNYICVVPMSISIVFAILYGYLKSSYMIFCILMISAVCINFKHIENIKRIKAGTEARFSLLWNRKEEALRLGKTYDNGKGYDKVEEKLNEHH